MQADDVRIDERFNEHELPNTINMKVDENVVTNHLGVPVQLVNYAVVTRERYWSDKPELDEAIIKSMKHIITQTVPIEMLYLMKDAYIEGFNLYLRDQGTYMNKQDVYNMVNVIFSSEFKQIEQNLSQFMDQAEFAEVEEEDMELPTTPVVRRKDIKRERSEGPGQDLYQLASDEKRNKPENLPIFTDDDEETVSISQGPLEFENKFDNFQGGGFYGILQNIGNYYGYLKDIPGLEYLSSWSSYAQNAFIGSAFIFGFGGWIGDKMESFSRKYSINPHASRIIHLVTALTVTFYIQMVPMANTISDIPFTGTVIATIGGIDLSIVRLLTGSAMAYSLFSTYRSRLWNVMIEAHRNGSVEQSLIIGGAVFTAVSLGLYTVYNWWELSDIAYNSFRSPMIENLNNTTQYPDLTAAANELHEMVTKTPDQAGTLIKSYNMTKDAMLQLFEFSKGHFEHMFQANRTLLTNLKNTTLTAFDESAKRALAELDKTPGLLQKTLQLAQNAGSESITEGTIDAQMQAAGYNPFMHMWIAISTFFSVVGSRTADTVINMTTDTNIILKYLGQMNIGSLEQPVIQRLTNIAHGQIEATTLLSDLGPTYPIAASVRALGGNNPGMHLLGQTLTAMWLTTLSTAMTLQSVYMINQHYGDSSINRIAFHTFGVKMTEGNLDALTVLDCMIDQKSNMHMFKKIDQDIKDRVFKRKNVNILSAIRSKMDEIYTRHELENVYKILKGQRDIPQNMDDDQKRVYKDKINKVFGIIQGVKRVLDEEMKKPPSPSDVNKVKESVRKEFSSIGGAVVGKNDQWLIQDVPGDGACFFRAVVNVKTFINSNGFVPAYQTPTQDELAESYRKHIVDYARANSDERIPMLGKTLKQEVLNNEDYWDVDVPEKEVPKEHRTFENFLRRLALKKMDIRGYAEIYLLAKIGILQAPIHVYNMKSDNPFEQPVATFPDGSGNNRGVISIAWNGKTTYGGHYYALYPKGDINVKIMDKYPMLKKISELADGNKAMRWYKSKNEWKTKLDNVPKCDEFDKMFSIKTLRDYNKVQLKEGFHPDKISKDIQGTVHESLILLAAKIINDCRDYRKEQQDEKNGLFKENPQHGGDSKSVNIDDIELSDKGFKLQELISERLDTVLNRK